MNSNKKKGRATSNNKVGRPKAPSEKNVAFDGVYNNARFMHAAASLVGCVVQVQVKNGSQYEGIFRTFSQQLDLVLETAHKLDKKTVPAAGVGPSVSSLLASFPCSEEVSEKLIFKLQDVVMLSAVNVDPDYATRDNFTDTGISKFNGQLIEKELEPWEGLGEEVDGLTLEADEDSNGWDVDDMFRTNAEKYGVKTCYDNTLHEYTVPLERKNTEEYKKQEDKASKIAQEIEGSVSYQRRIAMENGDEEERFSAVVRPENNSSMRYASAQQRRRNVPGAKRIVSTSGPSPIHSTPGKSFPSQHASTLSTNQGPFKTTSLPSTNCVSSPSPTSPTAPALKQPFTTSNIQTHHNAMPPGQNSTSQILQKDSGDDKALDEIDTEDQKVPWQNAVKEAPLHAVKAIPVPALQPLPPRQERINDKRRDSEKKSIKQKGRDDEIEEFKKFSTDFKLSDDTKETKETKEEPKVESNPEQPSFTTKTPEQQKEEKENEKNKEADIEKALVLKSTLNPNAKEFTLNPNAKAFTPRSLSIASPHGHSPHQSPQMHTQSPVMALQQHQLMPGLAQPIFTTMTPQYVMSPTPVSVSLTSPYGNVSSVPQAPRFRKTFPLVPPRHDLTPSVHVAAATGQPILAPAAIPTPQLTMQYTPPPGMIPTAGPPQAAMYQQMYQMLGPRVMSSQPVGMVPTSHAASYGDPSHLPAQIYMSPHPGAAGIPTLSAPHAMNLGSVPQGVTGPHSNTPPQSQTPGLRAAPSPVHQPPPSQTPTPTGHPGQPPTPQQVVYHGPMSQHPLQPGPHNHNGPPPQNHHVTHVTQPHPSGFAGAPQPVVLMPHGPHPGSIPSSGPHALQGHPIHGQNPGNHAGTPPHVLPPMTVIPTSAGIVPAPAAMATAPFVPHPQGV